MHWALLADPSPAPRPSFLTAPPPSIKTMREKRRCVINILFGVQSGQTKIDDSAFRSTVTVVWSMACYYKFSIISTSILKAQNGSNLLNSKMSRRKCNHMYERRIIICFWGLLVDKELLNQHHQIDPGGRCFFCSGCRYYTSLCQVGLNILILCSGYP